MQMSKVLLQQQDLRQTSNICKHSINISMPKPPTQPWYQVTYGIIKSILSKPRRYKPKPGSNPALSPHHCHKLPLNHVSKLSMTSWWKYHPLTMRINQGIKPSKNSKCTSWAPQKKLNNHDPQPRRYTTITKSKIRANKNQGCTYITNHVIPKSMAPWSHPWTKHLALNMSNLSA